MNVIPFPIAVVLTSATPEQEFVYLDALSRTRALTNAESNRLEKVIRLIDAPKSRRTFQHWTPEEDARLLALRAGGLTYSQIAKAMNRTKCSVMGRSHGHEQKRATGQ